MQSLGYITISSGYPGSSFLRGSEAMCPAGRSLLAKLLSIDINVYCKGVPLPTRCFGIKSILDRPQSDCGLIYYFVHYNRDTM